MDIAELISEYISLKPSGPASFKALCPFHGEKTPSFHVSTDKQIWHCFGCSEGGDCYSFLMKMEGMDFLEALRHLGKKVGVEVKRFDTSVDNERQRLLDLHDLAAKYYRKVLTDSASAEVVRSYVVSRGISAALAEQFGLGYAPDAWDQLTAFLVKRGFPTGEQERAGLVSRRKSGDGVYDRFRNRLMIPLCDQHGNVVGFTARILPATTPSNSAIRSEDEGPKYLNSPETAIYHKGRMLYGLHLAKQSIKREGKAIIVEGNLDVIASHKAGVEHVVGSSGTALTEDQLSLLKRFTNTILFCFDADAAGFKAAQRGIALARSGGFDVRAVVLPSDAGKDPDDAVQKNPDVWKAAVTKSVPIMQFLIERAVAGRDLANVDDKRAVGALLLPELAQISDVVEREHWIQSVADLLRMDTGALRLSLSFEPRSSARPSPVSTRTPTPTIQNLSPVTRNPKPLSATHFSRMEQAADQILGLFLQNHTQRATIVARLTPDLLSTESHRRLYNAMLTEYHASQSTNPAPANYFGALRNRLGTDVSMLELLPLLDRIGISADTFSDSDNPDAAATLVNNVLGVLSQADLDARRRALEADIRRAEAAGDHAEVDRLIRAYHELRS